MFFKKNNCYFRTTSKKLIQDLIYQGCIVDKTKNLKNLPLINDYLMKYFILGFYDGDGIASHGKQSYMGFCGTHDMLMNISLFLQKKLNLKEKNPYYNKTNKIYYLIYGAKGDIEKIFDYFYKDTNIPYLIRKKEKIENFLNANTEIT